MGTIRTVGLVCVFGPLAWLFGWYAVKLGSRWLARDALNGLSRDSASAWGAVDQRMVPWLILLFVFLTFLLTFWLVARDGLDFEHCLLLASLFAAPTAAFCKAVELDSAIRRRRTLKGGDQEDLSIIREQQSITHRPRRNIVICCDGTGNKPQDLGKAAGAKPNIAVLSWAGVNRLEQRGATNVFKLYDALVDNEEQMLWYDAGVATDTSPQAGRINRVEAVAATVGIAPMQRTLAAMAMFLRLKEAITGGGVIENVVEAYTFLARAYRPGDRIYLIGFSRGAWTVRCLAAVIARCGILRPSCVRYAEDVVHFLRVRRSADEPIIMCPSVTDMSARVAFLGVFDTVAALGFPLWGWWFKVKLMWPKLAWTSSPASICDAVYHAVSMDERRSQYFVTLFDEQVPHTGQTIEQVWFRGDHSDIGGGRYDTSLSDITLKWMIEKAKHHGLRFKDEEKLISGLECDPLGFIHDELRERRKWRFFGSWPRWFPTPRDGEDKRNGFGTLHPSVFERATGMHNLGCPDLVFLGGADDPPSIEVEVWGNAEWSRSGVVLMTGKTYRIQYKDGQWRDGTGDCCGPDGEPPGQRRFLPSVRIYVPRFPEVDARGRPEWNKKGRSVAKMTLIATVAHPRAWPPADRRLSDALGYLFRRGPIELIEQLAPIGCDLVPENDSVYLRVADDVPHGMVWFFANDYWMAASNNSGSVRLTIEHIDAPTVSGPLWTLQMEPRGETGAKRAVWSRTPSGPSWAGWSACGSASAAGERQVAEAVVDAVAP